MKRDLIASLEPLLLLRARKLAEELPAERRSSLALLSNAAKARSRLAQTLREPEQLPVALVLSREAFVLSVSAELAARGELPGQALSAREAVAAAGGLADELRPFLSTEDPAFADRLSLAEQRALLLTLERALAERAARYEAKPPRVVALQGMLRLALAVCGVVLAFLAFLSVTSPP